MKRFVMVAVIGAIALTSGLLIKADGPQVASGTWISAGDPGVLPQDTAAVALADGRLVIAGGRNTDGKPVAQIGIYDPPSQSWEDGGHLIDARAGHTATLLQDGRVLFAGGAAAHGVTSGIEVYDPATRTSVAAGAMWVPRVHHAAAALQDGTVLIVGGSDGTSPLAYAEIFNPETGQTASLPVTLSTARAKATATALLDGHVLVAGGNDGTQDLASAELFDPPSQSFFATGAMQTPRSGHSAVLLPNNNQVLIAGGLVGGEPTTSAELYADWRDGFSAAPQAMTAARTGAVGAGLAPHDLALVLGGGPTHGEFFDYATVKTDKADYLPGEIVTITGAGWQPGERVSLKISEDADTHHDFAFTAVADSNGKIVNQEFFPRHDDEYQHIGMRFYLAAAGSAWQALNTFTDGNADFTGVITDAVTGLPITGASVACATGCAVSSNRTNPTGAIGRYDIQVSFSGNQALSYSLLATASGYASATTAVASINNKVTRTHDFSLTPAWVATQLTVIAATGSYGGSAALHATLTAGGAAVSSKTIAFTLNGQTVGTATTNNSGVASLNNANLAGVAAGTYASGVAATFAADGGYASASGSNSLTVTPKPATGSFTAASRAYDGTTVASVVTTALSDVLAGDTAHVSLTGGTASFADANAGTGKTVTLTGATLSGTAAGNYSLTSVSSTTADITPKPAMVTATDDGKTYGGTEPTLAATGSGFLAADVAGITLSATRAAGENVDEYVITPSATGGNVGNYDVTYVAGTFTISPKTAMVTADPKEKSYGAANPILTATVTGLVGSETLDYTLITTADASSAVGSYPITVTLGANPNYDVTATDGALTVIPATLTVTANGQAKVYGEADPSLSYEVSGLTNGDTSSVITGALARDAGEDVGSYAITQGSLTAGANYTVSFAGAMLTVTKRPLTVAAVTSEKVYDGGTSSAGVPTITVGSLASGDSGSWTQTFDQAAAGPRTLKAAGTVIDGNGGNNYEVTFVDAAGTVTPKVLSGSFTAANREYNGTVAASVVTTLLSGVLAGDTANVSLTGGPATFANPNAGTGKTVTLTGATLSGVAAGNYSLTSVSQTTADITPKPVTGSFTAANKPFDGTTAATILTRSLNGVLAADSSDVTLIGGTATFDSAAVGIGKTVTLIGAELSGRKPENYTLASVATTTADITAWQLSGFHQPVGIANTYPGAPSAGSTTLWNTLKAGSTVPLKFNIFATLGGTELTSTSDVLGIAIMETACGGGFEDLLDQTLTTSGATTLRYDTTAGQFIQNWQTPRQTNKCYRATMTARDGSRISAFFKTR